METLATADDCPYEMDEDFDYALVHLSTPEMSSKPHDPSGTKFADDSSIVAAGHGELLQNCPATQECDYTRINDCQIAADPLVGSHKNAVHRDGNFPQTDIEESKLEPHSTGDQPAQSTAVNPTSNQAGDQVREGAVAEEVEPQSSACIVPDKLIDLEWPDLDNAGSRGTRRGIATASNSDHEDGAHGNSTDQKRPHSIDREVLASSPGTSEKDPVPRSTSLHSQAKPDESENPKLCSTESPIGELEANRLEPSLGQTKIGNVEPASTELDEVPSHDGHRGSSQSHTQPVGSNVLEEDIPIVDDLRRGDHPIAIDDSTAFDAVPTQQASIGGTASHCDTLDVVMSPKEIANESSNRKGNSDGPHPNVTVGNAKINCSTRQPPIRTGLREATLDDVSLDSAPQNGDSRERPILIPEEKVDGEASGGSTTAKDTVTPSPRQSVPRQSLKRKQCHDGVGEHPRRSKRAQKKPRYAKFTCVEVHANLKEIEEAFQDLNTEHQTAMTRYQDKVQKLYTKFMDLEEDLRTMGVAE